MRPPSSGFIIKKTPPVIKWFQLCLLIFLRQFSLLINAFKIEYSTVSVDFDAKQNLAVANFQFLKGCYSLQAIIDT